MPGNVALLAEKNKNPHRLIRTLKQTQSKKQVQPQLVGQIKFATFETRRELEPKCVPQLFLVTGEAPVSYWPVFSMSLVMVPEFFAKVKEAQSSSV